MSTYETYHPRNAVADPEAYYDDAFENYPKPWLVRMVGNAAMKLIRPSISYHEADNETEYFDRIDPESPLVITLSHRGIEKFHDPAAGARAVFGTEPLLKRVDSFRVWAAVPYMTDKKLGPILKRLGCVPVIRSEDYKKYEMDPDVRNCHSIKEALFDHSIRHLQQPGNVLAIFPVGTRGGEKIREGAGHVLERLSDATAISIAMVSDSEKTGNFPRNLRIAFGEEIVTKDGMAYFDYVEEIDRTLFEAETKIGG